jgi:hypothetical protein
MRIGGPLVAEGLISIRRLLPDFNSGDASILGRSSAHSVARGQITVLFANWIVTSETGQCPT